MKASEAEAQRAKLAQPLTLGLLQSICKDLLVDSHPTTKLVAIAILRNIGKLQPPAKTTATKQDQAIALVESWLTDTSGYDKRVWPKLSLAIERNRLSDRPHLEAGVKKPRKPRKRTKS